MYKSTQFHRFTTVWRILISSRKAATSFTLLFFNTLLKLFQNTRERMHRLQIDEIHTHFPKDLRTTDRQKGRAPGTSNSFVWTFTILRERPHSCAWREFSSVLWLIGSSVGHEGRFSTDPLPVFSAGGPCEQIWHWQICPLFDVVRLAFPLPITASSILQGRRVWHARNMLVSVTWQLPEESSRGPTRKLILFRTQSLVLRSK